MKIAALLLLLFAAEASAAGPVAGASQAYQLRNLKPVGLARQNAGATSRELLQFQNDQGSQNIVYEESAAVAPLKEVARLAPFLASGTHTCSIDLDCKAKAFCTNDCRSLFYEVTNAPGDPALAEKSNCVIKSFSCTTGENRSAASTTVVPLTVTPIPAPAPAPAPVAPTPAPAAKPKGP